MKKHLLFLLFATILLLCVSCATQSKFDYLDFPLPSNDLRKLSDSCNDEANSKAVIPAEQLDAEIKWQDNMLMKLTDYYKQHSGVIEIKTKDIRRVDIKGRICLIDNKQRPLNGVYVFALHKNVYVIMDIGNGLPNGFCEVFYYWSGYTSYCRGYYKNGNPISGTFAYIYEKDQLLPLSFRFYKGSFIGIETNLLFSTPLWEERNTIGYNGKIINGYQINEELKFMKKIEDFTFLYYKSSVLQGKIKLKDTSLPFPEILNKLNDLLRLCIQIASERPEKSWR